MFCTEQKHDAIGNTNNLSNAFLTSSKTATMKTNGCMYVLKDLNWMNCLFVLLLKKIELIVGIMD